MYRDNSFGARCDRFCKTRGVQSESAWIDIHQHRRRAAHLHGSNRRHRGVRDGDDLVPRTDVAGPQCKVQRVGAAIHAHAISGADVGGKFAFKAPGLIGDNEAGRCQHTAVGFIQVGAHALVNAAEINERHTSDSDKAHSIFTWGT